MLITIDNNVKQISTIVSLDLKQEIIRNLLITQLEKIENITLNEMNNHSDDKIT